MSRLFPSFQTQSSELCSLYIVTKMKSLNSVLDYFFLSNKDRRTICVLGATRRHTHFLGLQFILPFCYQIVHLTVQAELKAGTVTCTVFSKKKKSGLSHFYFTLLFYFWTYLCCEITPLQPGLPLFFHFLPFLRYFSYVASVLSTHIASYSEYCQIANLTIFCFHYCYFVGFHFHFFIMTNQLNKKIHLLHFHYVIYLFISSFGIQFCIVCGCCLFVFVYLPASLVFNQVFLSQALPFPFHPLEDFTFMPSQWEICLLFIVSINIPSVLPCQYS